MRTAILILVLAMGACAAESPHETEATGDLCTADDPNCGPPGSNPAAARTAENQASANYAPSADPGSERISCSYEGQGQWGCEAVFSIFGKAYGGFCTIIVVWDAGCGCNVISAWTCQAGIPR